MKSTVAVLIVMIFIALVVIPQALGMSVNFFNSTLTVTVTTSNGPVTNFNLSVIEGNATQVYRVSNDIEGTAKAPVAWISNATVFVTAEYPMVTKVTHITNTTTSVITTTVTATNNVSYVLPSLVIVPTGSRDVSMIEGIRHTKAYELCSAMRVSAIIYFPRGGCSRFQ